MMTGNPFPNNAWLTYAEATARWGKPTSPKQVEYILATPAALSDHPAVLPLVAAAEARGMERAVALVNDLYEKVCTSHTRTLLRRQVVTQLIALEATIRAEAAAIRGETT